MSWEGKCRVLCFHTTMVSLPRLKKKKRSPSALNTSFEVVADSKKHLEHKDLWHRGDKIGVNSLLMPLCTPGTPRVPEASCGVQGRTKPAQIYQP